MDATLTDNFLDDDVGKLLLGDWLAFFIKLVFEDVESKTLLLGEDFVNKEFMLLVCMREENNLLPSFPSFINVSYVIITVLDRFLRCNKFADVDRTGVTELLQVVSQILQVVT